MEIEYTYHRIFTAALKNSKDQSLIPTDYKECVKNRICQHSLLVGQLKLYLKHFQGILFLYSREKKGSQKGIMSIPLCISRLICTYSFVLDSQLRRPSST